MKPTYTEINGYLIPDLILPETDSRPIGKYGELRRQFLREHRPDLFDLMLLEGTLHSHLADVDAEARQMVEDKTVIFINGCFWHGHDGCRYFVWPESNAAFWHDKIEKNKCRDAKKEAQLRNSGWNVITVWECELRPKAREDTLRRLEQELREILPKE